MASFNPPSTNDQTPKQLSVDDFAAKIKAKYPEYAKMDNKELVDKIVTKYPEYKQNVNYGDVKKKDVSHDFTQGYKPTPQDIQQKNSLNAVQTGSEKLQSGSNPSQNTNIASVPGFTPVNTKGELIKHDYSSLFDKKPKKVQPEQPKTIKNARLLTKEEENKYIPKGVQVNPVAAPTEKQQDEEQQRISKKEQQEEFPDNGGTYKNLPVFGARTIFGGLEKDLGDLLKFASDKANNVYVNMQAPGLSNAIGQMANWEYDKAKKDEEIAQKNPLPNTTMGQVTSSALGFGSDLIELAAIPELDIAKLGKLGDVITKYGGKYGTKAAELATGKFPIQQSVKGLLNSYGDAKKAGKSDADANEEAAKGFLSGYGNGFFMDIGGEVANKMTDVGKKALNDVGLMSGNKLVAGTEKRALHALSQGLTFSMIPFVTNAAKGKSTSLEEVKQNGLFGILTGAIGGSKGDPEKGIPSDADKAATQVVARSPLIHLNNFMNADMNEIKAVHDANISAADYTALSEAHAEDGFKATDDEQKQKSVLLSSLTGKAASIKTIADAISKDKQSVIDGIKDLPVSDDVKAKMFEKVDEFHKYDLAKQINGKDQEIEGLNKEVNDLSQVASQKTGDPIKDVENGLSLDKKKKELEKAQKEREDLNNQLKTIISNQQSNEKGTTQSEGGAQENGRPGQQMDERPAVDEKGEEKGSRIEQEPNEEVKQGAENAPITEPKVPDFSNVPILKLNQDDHDTAKNEIWNTVSQLGVGHVIDSDDGILVVTSHDTSKSGKQVIGITTFERQEDGSLREMTTPVFISKNADGTIRTDYEPHKTSTDYNGNRKTVTDKPTGKFLDLSKEKIVTQDENGNLVESNSYKDFKPIKEGEQENAVQEQSTGKVDVQPTSGNGEKVGEGNTEPKVTTEKGEEEGGKEKVTTITAKEKPDDGFISIQRKDLDKRIQAENDISISRRQVMSTEGNRLAEEGAKSGRDWKQQAEFEVNQLHNAHYNSDGSVKHPFNPTENQLAVIAVRLMDLHNQASATDFDPNSPEDVLKNNHLEQEILKAQRLLSTRQAGAAFGWRQELTKMGVDGHIEMTRKKLSFELGIKVPETQAEFDALNKREQAKLKGVFDKFQELKQTIKDQAKTVNTVNEKYSQEEFEKRLKAEVDKAAKGTSEPPKGNIKISKTESAKKIAANLHDLAAKIRAPLSDSSAMSDISQVIRYPLSKALDGIAYGIENGGKLADLIANAVDRFKNDDVSEDDLRKAIHKQLLGAGVDKAAIDEKTTKQGLFDQIKNLAKSENSEEITQSMVDGDLIKDYLHDIVRSGLHDPKDVMDKGVEELQSIFPDLTKSELRDAYLKEGNFQSETSTDIKERAKTALESFNSIAKLERDLELLKKGEELQSSDKSTHTKIISDYEKELKDKKSALLKERSDLDRAVKKAAADAKRQADKDANDAKNKSEKPQKDRDSYVKSLKDRISDLNDQITKGEKKDVSKVDKYAHDQEIEKLRKEREEKNKKLSQIDTRKADAKKAADKANRIKEIDKKLREIEEDRATFHKARKSVSIDKDIAKKKEELKQALIKAGIKLENGSKDSQAAKENVIKAHNERIDGLYDKINDKLTDPNLSDEERQQLEVISKDLQKSKLKIDGTNLSYKIDQGIKNLRDLSEKHGDTEFGKDVKELRIELEKDHKSAVEDIQLRRAKQFEKTRLEQAKRKLAAKQFDDTPKAIDIKKDNELLQAERARKKAEAELRYEADKYNKGNQSWRQRWGDRLMKAQRDNLISGIMTNGKVLISGIVKPVGDVLVRGTAGRLTMPLFKKLGIEGTREIQSTDAVFKSFMDSFKGMSKEKANGIRIKTTDALNKAIDNLNNIKDKNSLEFKQAKTEYDNAQSEWAASMLYDFITPGAWKDRLDILTKGSTDFEQSMGGYRKSGWGDQKYAIDKALYLLEGFGRLHGVEKDLSARQALVEGYLKRVKSAIEDGQQLKPSDLDNFVLQGYLTDYLSGKYQQKNNVSIAIRSAEKYLNESKYGKPLGTGLRLLTPVLKIPLNIDWEGIGKYTAGAPLSLGKTVWEIHKALKLNDKEWTGFIKDYGNTMQAVKDHMKDLDPATKDRIIDYANKGLIGGAVALIAGSMASKGLIQYGGAYNPDHKNKPRHFFNKETGKDDVLKTGEIEIDGHKFGKFWNAVILHLPILVPAVLSTVAVQKYQSEQDEIGSTKKDDSEQAISGVIQTAYEQSALTSLGNLEKSPSNILNSFSTQMAAKNISEYFDTDKDGNLIDRKATTVPEKFEKGWGFRSFLPKAQTEIDKKLSVAKDDIGNDYNLTAAQFAARKKSFNRNLKENKQEYTDDFNESWKDSKVYKKIQNNIPYWKSLGRSKDYIDKVIKEAHDIELEKYIQNKALEDSQDDIPDVVKKKASPIK